MRSLYLKTKSNKAIATIVVNCIESENLHELLGLTIHSKLTFESHNKLCKKASQKLLLKFLIIWPLIKEDINESFYYIPV